MLHLVMLNSLNVYSKLFLDSQLNNNYFLLKCTHIHQVICLECCLLTYNHSFIKASLKCVGMFIGKSKIIHPQVFSFKPFKTITFFLEKPCSFTYWSWCSELSLRVCFKISYTFFNIQTKCHSLCEDILEFFHHSLKRT